VHCVCLIIRLLSYMFGLKLSFVLLIG